MRTTAKQRLEKTRSKNADFLKRLTAPPDIPLNKSESVIVPLQLAWYSQNWSGRESKEVIVAYAREAGYDVTMLEDLSHKWFLTTYAGLIHLQQRGMVLPESTIEKITTHVKNMLTLAETQYAKTSVQKKQREEKRIADREAKYGELTTWLSRKIEQAGRGADETIINVVQQQLKQIRLTKDDVAYLTEFLDIEAKKDYSDESLLIIEAAKSAVLREKKTRKPRSKK